MRKKKGSYTKRIIIGILIVVSLSIITFFTINFSVTETSNINFRQYAGRWNNDELSQDWTKPIQLSNVAKFGEYEVTTSIEGYACSYSDYYCQPNTCKGDYVETDKHGCDIWYKPEKLLGTINSGRYQYTRKAGTKSSAYTGINIHCKVESGGTILNCEDGYQRVQGYYKDMSIYEGGLKCGGYTRDQEDCYKNCWGKYTVKKGEDIIYQSKDWETRRIDLKNDDVIINLNVNHKYDYGDCLRIENDFSYRLAEDSFVSELSTPSNLTQGEEGDINVKVQNNYKDGVYSKLLIDYTVPVLDFNATKNLDKIVELRKGENNFYYNVPTDRVTDKVTVTAKMDILEKGSSFSGVNGQCYPSTGGQQKPLSSCEYIKIASVKQEKYTISINEKVQIPSICKEKSISSLSECEAHIDSVLVSKDVSLQGKIDYIGELNDQISLQGQKLKELNLTSKQNADAIKQFEDEISNYHILIKNMNNTIKENAQIFINLDLEYKELLKQIEELSESKQEKDEYIVQLLNNIKGQDDKITELSSIIEINSDKILRMNATIEEQIDTINSLETSLDDKKKMIADMINQITEKESKLETLQREADKLELDYNKALLELEQLRKTTSASKEKITQLESLVDELDSSYENVKIELQLANEASDRKLALMESIISDLDSDFENSKSTIADLRNSLDSAEDRNLFMQTTITELKLNNEQLKTIINDYKSKVEDDAILIKNISDSNEQLKDLVRGYKDDLDKEKELTAQLQLDNEQLSLILSDVQEELIKEQSISKTIQKSNDNLNDQIAKLKDNLVTAEQIKDEMKITQGELNKLVEEYDLRVRVMSDYITGLELSNDRIPELITQISSSKEYQSDLRTTITELQHKNRMITLYSVSAGAVILLIIIITIKLKFKSKRKSKSRKLRKR